MVPVAGRARGGAAVVPAWGGQVSNEITLDDLDEYADYTSGMKLHQQTAWMPVWNEDGYTYPQTICHGDNWKDYRSDPVDWSPVLMEG